MDLAFAIALQFLASATAPGAPTVAWQVAPEVRCPTAAQLQAELVAHVRSLPASDRPDFPNEIRADVVRGPMGSTELHVSVDNPPLAFQRDIASSRCDEIAQTVAILITAWLLELREPAEAVAAAPPPVAPPIDGGPIEVVAAPAPVASPDKRVHLDLQLSFGPFVGEPNVTPALAVGVELRLPPIWAIGLQASWLGNLSASDSPYGSMQVHQQIYAAYLAAEIPPLQRALRHVLELRPFVGPLLWHGNAQSYGYGSTNQQDQWIPGLQFGILANRKIAGPVFVSLEVGAVVLAQSISYTVSRADGGTADLASIGPWAFEASLGVGAQVF